MMTVLVWVFFMVGDPTPEEPGTAYVQVTASPYQHAVHPEATEEECATLFASQYPSHPVCECGWRQQKVQVAG